MSKLKPIQGAYTTGQAARICYVSQQTIIRCFDQGALRGFKVPNSKFRRVTRESLVAFMIANKIPFDRLIESLAPDERAALYSVIGPVRVAAPEPIAAPVNRLAELVKEVA